MIGRQLPRNAWAAFCMLGAWAVVTLANAAGADSGAKAKPPLRGLVAMGSIGFHNSDDGEASNSLELIRKVPGVFAGVVINVTWRQLEPKRGQLDTRLINSFLDEIRAYNRESPSRPLGARLRVWSGKNAPVWAKRIGGEPVDMDRKGKPVILGRFWVPEYREAWRDLHNRLAAKYDPEPLIREVSNTSGSTETDEPFNLPGDEFSINNLLAAGFTDALFADILRQSYLDYAAWKTTPVEWTFSPYRELESGRPKPKWNYTTEMMHWWREKLGPRGVVGNHSLNNPIADHLQFIYEEIAKLGPPSGVQTHSPSGLDWEGSVRLAVELRIESLELWNGTKSGGFETKDAKTLKRWADMIEQAALRAGAPKPYPEK